ncbi:MAG: hypothetical protein IT369_17315 [Candidatus Latescibacteria bacterium]|nr:hypothetical protein [Candidatus Latescibacterota bacterium]
MKTNLRLTSVLALGLLAQGAFPASGRAQVDVWHLGKGGLSWASQAETQVGAVSVGGSLQPLEITPGVNLTRLLAEAGQQWQNNPPEDYTLGGLPHTWTNSNFFNGLAGPLKLVDGQDTTSTEAVFKSSGNPAGTAFFFDLGAAFPINRVRFYPEDTDPDGYMRAYELFVSDNLSFDSSRRPTYTSLRRVENNDTARVEVEFETSSTRFIQLKNLSKTPFSLAEFEIYGEGFLPVSSYISQMHYFGAPVNYGRLQLDATLVNQGEIKEPPSCVVQVRNGADDTPLNYFRSDRETGTETEVSLTEYETQLPRLAFFHQDPVTHAVLEELSREAYLVLPVEEQGPIRDFVRGSIRTDSENWSPWSVPMELDSTGSYSFDLNLPGPRPYLQFRVAFNGDAANTMRLDAFRLEYSPQLASAAVAEVALASEPAPAAGVTTVPSGVDTTFTCDIRTAFDQAGLAGFSGIRLSSFPAPVFEGLEMGSPPVPVAAAQVETTADGFSVFFAPAMNRQNNQSLRVVFRQQALEHNTAIDAWLLGPTGTLPQPVAAGNANDQVLNNALAVYTTDPAPAVQVTLIPAILTPNGDGINEATQISYSLIQFAGQIQMDVEVFDLSGRRVRQLLSATQPSGAYQLSWDGKDGGGQLLPPGNYLCRVQGKAQARTFSTEKVIGVVY